MEKYKSKIGKYGVRWEPVEGYKRLNGVKVQPHLKEVIYTWKNPLKTKKIAK